MAPRPKRNRRIQRAPFSRRFQPGGIKEEAAHEVFLLFEEFESVRLADYKHLTQAQAAKVMGVSRPTFTRIYEEARRKIAMALAESRSIVIEGGNYEIEENWFYCNDCRVSFRSDEGSPGACIVCGSASLRDMTEMEEKPAEKAGGGFAGGAGAEGHCICPKCEKRLPHERGVPCRTLVCDDCHVNMVREGSKHHRAIMEKKSNKKK